MLLYTSINFHKYDIKLLDDTNIPPSVIIGQISVTEKCSSIVKIIVGHSINYNKLNEIIAVDLSHASFLMHCAD